MLECTVVPKHAFNISLKRSDLCRGRRGKRQESVLIQMEASVRRQVADKSSLRTCSPGLLGGRAGV